MSCWQQGYIEKNKTKVEESKKKKKDTGKKQRLQITVFIIISQTKN